MGCRDNYTRFEEDSFRGVLLLHDFVLDPKAANNILRKMDVKMASKILGWMDLAEDNVPASVAFAILADPTFDQAHAVATIDGALGRDQQCHA